MNGIARVLVVGSINADLVLRVSRRPAAGETVVAGGVDRHHGGKGANQAVAAAAAGAHTSMVGAVGDDDWGRDQRQSLEAAGVDTTMIAIVADVATGFASITVTPDAENSIVVAGEANALVSPELVATARGGAADVVVAQTEIPVHAVDAAASLAERIGARFVLNTAPVVRLAARTLALADPLVVNEHEALQLLRLLAPSRSSSLEQIATELRFSSGARSLIVTLGSEGAIVLADDTTRLRAPRVAVVDTTGAGDVFVGTLAAHLAGGASLVDAARSAIEAAAHAVTRVGAR